ncbi:MAG: Coenzyme F420 hydrogenase/dehydrogenase, beta subunit C-terminal domain [Deltaproteobacteria bacterium]|nr:Coenzyme F420 hydrogenase/dehydrogenase, beta subunit C-terminal domain [Deltaproteobacteria bacterium]
MKAAILSVENGDPLAALRGFLRRLLETRMVGMILVPKALPSGAGFVQTLIRDPAMLDDVHPVAPTMPVQSARILSGLTVGDPGERIGAVLKPCELRAAVELTKFLQVKLDHLVTIGVDCPGTYEVEDYARVAGEKGAGDSLWEGMVRGVKTGRLDGQEEEGIALRLACRICENPVPVNADITFGFFGHDPSREIEVIVGERVVGEFEERGIIGLSSEESSERGQVLSQLKEARIRKRDEVLL